MLFLCASGLERAKVFENEGGVGSVSELAHSGGPVSVAPLGFKRAPRDGPQTSHPGRFFRGITRDLTEPHPPKYFKPKNLLEKTQVCYSR